eukprot:3916036-Heterocapsa_arctica.AAC.1
MRELEATTAITANISNEVESVRAQLTHHGSASGTGNSVQAMVGSLHSVLTKMKSSTFVPEHIAQQAEDSMRTLYNDVLKVANAAKMQSASASSTSAAPAVGGAPVRDLKL